MNAVSDMAWFAIDQLPKTGVKISVMVFGGLTLLILGGGLFLASRRQHRTPPPPPDPPHVLAGLVLTQQDHHSPRFNPDETGQPVEEGGEPGRPGSRTGGVIDE